MRFDLAPDINAVTMAVGGRDEEVVIDSSIDVPDDDSALISVLADYEFLELATELPLEQDKPPLQDPPKAKSSDSVEASAKAGER